MIPEVFSDLGDSMILFPFAEGHIQLTLPSPDPEDGCLVTQGLHSLPQAFGVHLFPCQNAQELPVVLGLVVLRQQLMSLKEMSLLIPPEAL